MGILYSDPLLKGTSEMGSPLPSSGSSEDAQEIGKLITDLVDRKYVDRPNSKVFSTTSSDKSGKSTAEILFDSLARAKLLTSQVAMHIDLGWRSRLFEQLDDLLNVEDWHEEDCPLSASSFETFLRLIIFYKIPRRPGFGLSDRGNLVAAWTSGADRLTVEFFSNDITRWVLSCVIEDQTERAAGETPVRRFMEVLSPYQPNRWFELA